MRLGARDRRQAPRRQEEVALNVAEMSLMAAALKVASARRLPGSDSEWRRSMSAALAGLDRAADFYETAERDAIAARQAVSA